MKSFLLKFEICMRKVKENIINMFSWLNEFIIDNKLSLNVIIVIVFDYLASLNLQSEKYFPDLNIRKVDWVSFQVNIEEVSDHNSNIQD